MPACTTRPGSTLWIKWAPLLAALGLAPLVAGAAGCRSRAPAPTDELVSQRARQSLAPFKGALKAALTDAMVTSPEAAIDVCAVKAPELARQHSRDGVVVGRSALKLRNAGNAPRPWLVPVMAELAGAPSGSDASRVVALPDGRRGYAEAIWIQPPCLACHGGPEVTPSVDQLLRARYPADQARGFHAGDLRGVFWAELDAAVLAPR